MGFDGVVCGSCTALVNIQSAGGTCQDFCESQDLSCVNGWDDTENESCSPNAPKMGCDGTYGSSSDAVCQCTVNGEFRNPEGTGSILSFRLIVLRAILPPEMNELPVPSLSLYRELINNSISDLPYVANRHACSDSQRSSLVRHRAVIATRLGGRGARRRQCRHALSTSCIPRSTR